MIPYTFTMSKLHHILISTRARLSHITLTTPTAILVGACVIGLSILGYGYMMSHSSSTSPVSDPLPKILKAANLNKKAFLTCVSSGATQADVAASVIDGGKIGVNGTPATFILKDIEGKLYTIAMISGAQDEAVFSQAITQAQATNDITKLQPFNGLPISESTIEGGKRVSDVYVVEYSDAECPFCIRLHTTMKHIRTTHLGTINFVYRQFPLTSIHQYAQKESEMILCAEKLGGEKAMYSYIDASFDYKIKNNTGFLPITEN